MRLCDIDSSTRLELDSACGGWFSDLQDHCEQHGYEAHLSIQTHLEGLPKGEMKLYVQLVSGLDMVDYAIAKLGGKAKVIGWNIYLHDTVGSARNAIHKAHKTVVHETRTLH